jgi:hypothetical protein
MIHQESLALVFHLREPENRYWDETSLPGIKCAFVGCLCCDLCAGGKWAEKRVTSSVRIRLPAPGWRPLPDARPTGTRCFRAGTTKCYLTPGMGSVTSSWWRNSVPVTLQCGIPLWLGSISHPTVAAEGQAGSSSPFRGEGAAWVPGVTSAGLVSAWKRG